MKNSFLHFKLDDKIMKSIKDLGFKKPTPIQNKVIPHLLLSNQDLIATADRDREDSCIWTATFATN